MIVFLKLKESVKKEALKIDHLLGFACHTQRNSNEGVWQAFSARKPKIKLRGPMTSSSSDLGQARSQVRDEEIQ